MKKSSAIAQAATKSAAKSAAKSSAKKPATKKPANKTPAAKKRSTAKKTSAATIQPHNAANPPHAGGNVLDRLHAVIMDRRTADPAHSHSARLLSRGPAKVAQKFGEEAVECLIEAVAGNPAALIAESADVLYHLLVMWVSTGVAPDQVWTELARREGISGVDEKAARPRQGTSKIP